MSLADFRNRLTLIILALYLLLNSGFMLVRFPPQGDFALPFGELVLVVYMIWFADLRWFSKLSHTVVLLPFLIWWGLGIGRALAGVPQYGVWALRDATHVIESLFLWVGFVFAAKPQSVELLFRWVPRLLTLGCIYGLTYPWNTELREDSPKLESLAGPERSFFFNYLNTAMLVLAAAAYRVINRPAVSGPGPVVFATFLICYTVLVFQARTVYLQVLAILMLFAWYRREAFGKLSFAVVMTVCIMLLMGELGLTWKGRFGEEVGVDFIIRHFMSIFGVEAEGVTAAAGGVMRRMDWWTYIWVRLTADLNHLLFGMGYGIALTDLITPDGAQVREPHNSYLSVLARIGFVGLFAFIWMHINMFRVWLQAHRLCKRAGYRIGQNRLLIVLVYFLMIWVYALGEDAMEKPFNTIPYYFLWGVVLHYSHHLRELLTAPALDETLSPAEFRMAPVARSHHS